MELTEHSPGRDQLVRTALAAGLAGVALWSLRRGKRLRGALAGLGAVAFGYSAATAPGDMTADIVADLDAESASETAELRCAICGDPIVAGQSRRPNENDETVHEACLTASG